MCCNKTVFKFNEDIIDNEKIIRENYNLEICKYVLSKKPDIDIKYRNYKYKEEKIIIPKGKFKIHQKEIQYDFSKEFTLKLFCFGINKYDLDSTKIKKLNNF